MAKIIIPFAVIGTLLKSYEAQAQPISASFYGENDCDGLETWRIRAPREACLPMPNNPASTYMVYCDTPTGGTFIPCADAECANCPVALRSTFANDQCVPIPDGYSPDLLTVSVDCAIGEDVTPLALPGASTTALVTYFPSGDCTMPDGYRTEFVVGSAECNTINGNPITPAMQVTCYPDGSGGLYHLYADVECTGTPSADTPFTSGQCLPQGPQGGESGSVQIVCAPIVPDVSPPPVLPSTAPTSSPDYIFDDEDDLDGEDDDIVGASSAGQSNLSPFVMAVAAASVAVASAMSLVSFRG